uniref:Uncharacterized protein n=1 Tax=Scophthalmus maximus TaxID=52904 RepID=A0A8D3DND1_SCOMX
KKYLSVAVLLCGLLSLSDAQCFANITTSHCLKWKEEEFFLCLYMFTVNCLLCDCRYSTPRHFPSDCVSVFDSEACVYRVHKKDDPTVQCPIYAEVGK